VINTAERKQLMLHFDTKNLWLTPMPRF